MRLVELDGTDEKNIRIVIDEVTVAEARKLAILLGENVSVSRAKGRKPIAEGGP